MILLLDLYVKFLSIEARFAARAARAGLLSAAAAAAERRARAACRRRLGPRSRRRATSSSPSLDCWRRLPEHSRGARATHRSSTRSASGHSERAPNRAIQARRRGGAAQLAAICAAHEEAMAALAAQGARGMRLAEERFQGATEVGEHALRAQLEAERAPTHRPLHFEPPSGKRGSRCGFLLRGV